jgi:hypothetical protein
VISIKKILSEILKIYHLLVFCEAFKHSTQLLESMCDNESYETVLINKRVSHGNEY